MGMTATLTVACMLGFLSGLGIGGGSLLMLWLTLVLGMDTMHARGLNLLFFLPSALVACFFRWKQGYVPWKKILPAIISGSISAAVFSWLSMRIETHVLRKLFGALLVITGLREMTYKTKKQG